MSNKNSIEKRDQKFNAEMGIIALIILYIIYWLLISFVSDNIISFLTNFGGNIYFIKIVIFLILTLPLLLFMLGTYYADKGLPKGKIIFTVIVGFLNLASSSFQVSEGYIKETIAKGIDKTHIISDSENRDIQEEQKNGNGIEIDSSKTLKSIAISCENNDCILDMPNIKLPVNILNNSEESYGDTSTSINKQLFLSFPKQEVIINGKDLSYKGMNFPMEGIIDSNGGKGEIIISIEEINQLQNNLHMFLKTNDDIKIEKTDYYIQILNNVNVAIVNSSGEDGLAREIKSKIFDSKLSEFGVAVVDNGKNMDKSDMIRLKKKLFEKNEILYFEDSYVNIINTINDYILNSRFQMRKISRDDCYDYIYDNEIFYKGKKISTPFDGSTTPSTHSLCDKSNIIINTIYR